MTERIDHASRALFLLDGLHDYQAEQGVTDEVMLTVAIEAQALATLALVEQQRIANLLRLGGDEWLSDQATNAVLNITPARGPIGQIINGLQPDIAAALGLTAGQEGDS